MDLLRRLRLNCLLAPLVPVVILLLVVAFGLARLDDQAARQWSQERLASLALLALEGPGLDPAAALARDRRWAGLAVMVLDDDDRIRIESSAGKLPELLSTQAGPELVDAQGGAVAWQQQEVWLMAAPLRDEMLRPVALVLALADAGPRPLLERRLQFAGIIALLLLGLIMSWYTAARIWRPVEALQREAEAALRGQPLQLGPRSSETAGLASAVSELASAFREARGGDAGDG